MRGKSFALSVMVGFLLVIGALTTVFGPALVQGDSSYRTAPAPVFPKNASGETYGSDAQSTSLATEPDLILAKGVNGEPGYVRASDLYGKMPQNPQDALRINASNKSPRKIPLYAVDGKTVIGSFSVGSGTTTLAAGNSSK